MNKITKGEGKGLVLFVLFGLFVYLVSAGLREIIIAKMGDGTNLIIAGIIGLLVFAYFIDLKKQGWIK